jgi:hypothetical protein
MPSGAYRFAGVYVHRDERWQIIASQDRTHAREASGWRPLFIDSAWQGSV